MKTQTPSQDNDQLCDGPPNFAEGVHDDHAEESEWLDSSFDEVTRNWIEMPEAELRPLLDGYVGCFRGFAVWSLHSYGMPDEAIARRLSIDTDSVSRILRPLEYIVEPPACIKKEDQQLWTDVWNGRVAKHVRSSIRLVLKCPGIPLRRVRAAVSVLDAPIKACPSLRDLKVNHELAIYHVATDSALQWRLTGEIDCEEVAREIEEFLLDLDSPDSDAWRVAFWQEEMEMDVEKELHELELKLRESTVESFDSESAIVED